MFPTCSNTVLLKSHSNANSALGKNSVRSAVRRRVAVWRAVWNAMRRRVAVLPCGARRAAPCGGICRVGSAVRRYVP
eukprot:gene11030-biopygen2290